MPVRTKPLPEMSEGDVTRFWQKVSVPDLGTGCMVWLASLTKGGYGQMKLSGSNFRSHRIAMTLAYGEIPPGMVIDHLCKNRRCCNPDHLRVVTMDVNTRAGDSPSALNMKKTHCSEGHEYSEENTYVTKPGYRACRECHRTKNRESQRKRRLDPGLRERERLYSDMYNKTRRGRV